MTEKTHNEPSKGKTLQLKTNVKSVEQKLASGQKNTVKVEVRKRARSSVEKPTSTTLSSSAAIEDDSMLSQKEKDARLKALAGADDIRQERQKKAEESSKRAKEAKEKAAKVEEEVVEEKTTEEPPAIPEQPIPPAEGKTPERVELVKKESEDQAKKPKRKPRMDESKRKNKLTISNAFQQEERMRSMASIKRAREKAKRKDESGPIETEKMVREIVVPETISVQELANRMAVRGQDVVKELMKLGIMANLTHTIDADTAELIVNDLGHKVKRVTDADVENILEIDERDDEGQLEPRAPIVTIMGHVDHGKTTLLDALRSTDVVSGEAGGITQHIGAYQIQTPSGNHITFLDTPGHAAFSAMRARGANVTDIVILVVAADDGIMPQTEEAINHAKAAEVPIIVAVNKMDKPDANPQRVKDALLSYELIPEELGGDIQVVEISAQEKMNLDLLEETILLQAEMLELKANSNAKASGIVVEAALHKGKGVTATFLVRRGTLQVGDIALAGSGFGKIRAITDDKGQSIKEAGPTMPVEVLGLGDLPSAGDEFFVVESEKQAREIVEYRQKQSRDKKAASSVVSVENLFQDVGTGNVKSLPVIVKGDVQGSVEAIVGSLHKIISDDEVQIKVVHAAAGAVNESDINLATTTNAIILGFNVRANSQAKKLIDEYSIDMRYYRVIYDLIDDVKALMSGMLSPVIRETYLGTAEVLQVFKVSKLGKVAGCNVTDGTIKRDAHVRIIREDIVIHEGKLKTLKRFKDEVNEVPQGTECGLGFESFDDLREGDKIEVFNVKEEQRVIE